MNLYPTINTFQSDSSPEWNPIFENAFFPFFRVGRCKPEFSTTGYVTIHLFRLSMNMYPTINTFQSDSSPEWNPIFEKGFFPVFLV